MESAEWAVKTRGMNTARTVKSRRMKYSPDSEKSENEIQPGTSRWFRVA